jgi:hypothetical protein
MLSTQTMLENATDTYNGKTGCACGCGGRYDSSESISGQKRIKKIMNADPATVQAVHFGNGEGCLEIVNQDGTRVTRVYFKVGA